MFIHILIYIYYIIYTDLYIWAHLTQAQMYGGSLADVHDLSVRGNHVDEAVQRLHEGGTRINYYEKQYKTVTI